MAKNRPIVNTNGVVGKGEGEGIKEVSMNILVGQPQLNNYVVRRISDVREWVEVEKWR